MLISSKGTFDKSITREIFPEYTDADRVWIYPLSQPLIKEQDISWVQSKLQKAMDLWKAHDQPVPGNFFIYRNHFVIISNPHEVSGCGIDSCFQVLREINRYLGGEIHNHIYYLDGDTVKSIPRHQVSTAINTKKITPLTPIINLHLTTLKEIREGRLETQAQMSFLSDYFEDL